MDKKQSSLSIAIGMACVWMGTHFGPGVASGTQILVYWVKYGIWGKKVWGVDWIVYLLDFSFIIVMLTALGGSLSAIGNLLNSQFGLNYWVGVGAVIVCAGLLCAYGATGKLHLGQALANISAGTVEGINPSFLGALWSGIIYASFQANVIGNISSIAPTLPDRKTTRLGAIIGICGNALMLVVLSLFFLSATTLENYDVLDTATNPLPFYGTLTALGFSGLKLVYVITVFIAVLSTAVGFSFGAVARYSKLYRKPTEEAPLKDGLLVVVLLLACAAASKIGIVKLVSTGYTILGYLNLPLLIFPAIVLANRKIQKSYLKENNIEATGIDD